MIQLNFFNFDNEETHKLREDIRKLKESNDKIRKSLFAKHGELAKHYLELLSRLEILERYICKGSYADHQTFGK